jgi:hypothetical protein
MGRSRVGLLALLTAAVLLPAASASAACPQGSWTAGTVELCRGKLVYHDYVYDDYGADRGSAGGKRWGSLSEQAGDDRYPDDAENSADLLGVELSVRQRRLYVRFPLSALYRGDETVTALAIDHTPGTGGGPWPGLKVSSAGWDEVHRFSRGDPRSNEIRGSVPLPPGGQWTIRAVAAQRDGTVMNVAFRGTGEEGSWWEANQAAALRDGDISQFAHTVRVACTATAPTTTR